jgi:hypothetical protein
MAASLAVAFTVRGTAPICIVDAGPGKLAYLVIPGRAAGADPESGAASVAFAILDSGFASFARAAE